VATPAVADFLLPEGFAVPGRRAVLREVRVVGEAGRLAWTRLGERVCGGPEHVADAAPVVLVPGFLAGDASLTALARALRARGHRPY
jgi:hypothetical protein